MPKANKRGKVRYKKPPGAPKRFKSSYMFFSTEKHIEIREELEKQGEKKKTTDIAKMVSAAWKSLTPEERHVWEVKANQDKVRYELEKSMYTGPWKVPTKRRAKDKDAPKRPMSAFLAYSHERRSQVKAANPKMDNIDVSRELAKMWKVEPQELKQKYIDEEAEKRQLYKTNIADWRAKNEEKEAAMRQDRIQRSISSLEAADSYAAARDVSLREASLNHPLVAAASSAVAASRFARSSASAYPGAAGADPYGADYYGGTSASSSYQPLYGQQQNSYSTSPWLSSASAAAYAREEAREQAAVAAAYARQEEQAAVAAALAAQQQSNPYGLDMSTVMGALSGGGSSAGSYGGLASNLASQQAAAYAAQSPYASTNLSNSSAYNYGGRSLLSQAEEQQLQQLQQQAALPPQDWPSSSYPSQQGSAYSPAAPGAARQHHQGGGGGGFPPTGYM